MVKAEMYIKRMYNYFKKRPMANCKILANKLSLHHFKEVKDVLMNEFE